MKNKYFNSSFLSFLGISMTGILAIKNTIDIMKKYNKILTIDDIKNFKKNDIKVVLKTYTPTILSIILSSFIIISINSKNEKVFKSLQRNLYLSTTLLNNTDNKIMKYKNKKNGIINTEKYTFYEPLLDQYFEMSFDELDKAFDYINTKFDIDGSISVGNIHNILNPSGKNNRNGFIFLKRKDNEYIDYKILSSYIDSSFRVNDLVVYIIEINKNEMLDK